MHGNGSRETGQALTDQSNATDPMRLTDAQRRAIVEETARLLGPDARVRLFGSRVDDSARGGDVDLLVETPDPVAQPALTAARLAVKIERRLDGWHVDIVLVTPETADQPIHDFARRHGMTL